MTDNDATRLSSPRIFLLRMSVFLILVGFVALILYKQIWMAFLANPGLNALIGGILLIGLVFAFRQVIRLFREVRWANALTGAGRQTEDQPVLLAPVAALLRDAQGPRGISTVTLRAMLDSVGMRLDEARELSRYLTGLLVFLGLLGTFWGLLETVGSIGGVIKSMQTGADAAVMFDDLKAGLSKPIEGMSISFTSSLFGLAGSLILGFLDLQAGQAQNRFYNELEDNLARFTSDPLAGLDATTGALRQSAESGMTPATATAMVNLAEGIQAMVQHMRGEQALIRSWVEAQAEQQREIRALLARLARESERQ